MGRANAGDERRINWVRPVLGAAGVVVVALAILVLRRFDSLLPSVGELRTEVGKLLDDPKSLLIAVGNSFQRVVVGGSIAYVLAFGAALATSRGRWWRWITAPYIVLAAATPSLVAALMATMIFGFSNVSVYAATVVVLFPYIWISLSETFDNMDQRLAEMTAAFGFSRWTYLRHVAIPEIAPDLLAALRSGHALGWKIVILTELVAAAGSPSIGMEYNLAYSVFNISGLVVWILFFLIVVWIVEYGILRPLSRRVLRWRA